MCGYPDNAFTIASADNLDFVHSHARVYCGKQQSSWHGTTVQLVQPQPSLSVQVTARETTTHAEATTSSDTDVLPTRHPNSPATGTLESRFQERLSTCKRSYSTRSLGNSPSKCSPIPKRQRRMRTGIEGAIRNLRDQLASSSSSSPGDYRCQTQPQKPALTIKDFHLSDQEDMVLGKLKEMSTQYILQKVASSDHSKTLIDLQTYFSLSNNLPTPECSNVIYFKVLDQRCDDKETLLNIINDLYEEFIVPKKKEWVLLEGDQATYARLQCIKAEYGKDLAWMIPFPGDWHFLKTSRKFCSRFILKLD